MQPRTLDQILGELNGAYEPQIQNIRKQQADIPNQIASETQGLQAKQSQAFDSILGGARQRGLGFSGIPLQEQAKYTSTEYLPALARLQQSGRQQAMTLEDSILGINERRQNAALGIRQHEQDMAFQEKQAAAARAAAAANSFNPSFGAGAAGAQQAQQKTDPMQQDAFNDVITRQRAMQGGQLNQAQILSDYNATRTSAGYGNVRDKYKLEFYHQLFPGLFNQGVVPASALANYSNKMNY